MKAQLVRGFRGRAGAGAAAARRAAVLLAIAAALAQGCQGPSSARLGRKEQPGAAREARGAAEPPVVRARVEVGEIVVADPQGKRLWRASADEIEWDHDKQQAIMRNVECVFLEDSKLTLEARAPLVTAYVEERRVVLSGGVAARSPVSRTALRAERLEWRAREKEVYATGNVKYVRGDFAISGPRLRADLALKRARLEGGVRMQGVEPFESE